METIRLQNPKALDIPEIKALFDKAIEHSPWKGLELTEELTRLISTPTVGILLTQEKGRFVGISIVFLPTSILDRTPQVAHLYNNGSTKARLSLISGTVDFITKAGYNRFWAINYTGKADKAWVKVMKPQHWEISPIGSIMEFKANG